MLTAVSDLFKKMLIVVVIYLEFFKDGDFFENRSSLMAFLEFI